MPSGNPIAGVNDLETVFPQIAKEAHGWDPRTVVHGSAKKVEWICANSHIWIATVNSRTSRGSGCPYCANKKVIPGFNDLKTTHPDIAAEAHGWRPQNVIAGNQEKREWKCLQGHTWFATCNNRTSNQSGCPYCTNRLCLTGFNDLKTLFPSIAIQADGWDPSKTLAGSHTSKSWVCRNGHKWQTTVVSRTSRNTGCPYCPRQAAGPNRTHRSGYSKVLKGENDLQTLFPTIADEASGWDPTEVTPGSSKKRKWRCSKGHTWEATPSDRVGKGSGCPYCANRKVLPGYNDLKTLYPDFAKEIIGSDPSQISSQSSQKIKWRCPKGHEWLATPANRIGNGSGCPVCAGRTCLSGFNDLETLYPELAEEADGWDPSQVLAGGRTKLPWRCKYGHTWIVSPGSRIGSKTGCPTCSGSRILKGFNDLTTTHPHLAQHWHKTKNGKLDPGQISFGSGKQVWWQCVKVEDHVWQATVNSRTFYDTGCPSCAALGFSPSEDSWFYLMERLGEQQLGITNNIKQRVLHHSKQGWHLIDSAGPAPGHWVAQNEKVFKQWLRSNIGVIPGTSENWYISDMNVRSLSELKAKSGISTDLF